MLKSSTLQIERIQATQQLNAIEVRSDDPNKEQRVAERQALETKINEINERLIEELTREDVETQAAMASHVDTDGWTPELREFRDLAQRVTIVDYVDSVISNNGQVRGAAAEYNQHVFGALGKPGDYPIEMLLDREEKVAFDGHTLKLWQTDNGEERTVITGPTGTHGMPSFVDRILAMSEGAFMGTMFPAVGPGPHAFPIVTGNTVAATIARGTAETPAGGVTINDVLPERVQHSYEIDSGDELRLPGVFGYMARDLRMSLQAGVDNKVIDAIRAGLTTTPPAGATLETLAAFMTRWGGVVNGRGARTIEDIRALLSTAHATTDAYNFIYGLSIANVGHAFTLLPHGRIRGSAHLPAASGDNGTVLFYGMAGGGGVYAPVWRRGQLLRDTGRLQREGQVTITGVAYTNVVVADSTPYRRGSIHMA